MPAEPWKVPDPDTFERVPGFVTSTEKNDGLTTRCCPTSATRRGVRPWIKPGTPDLMHRIGGIEKAYRHRQHRLFASRSTRCMTDARKSKVDNRRNIAVPEQDVCLGESGGQAGGGGLGLNLRADPPGGDAARASQGPRCQPHPCPPRLAAARRTSASCSRVTKTCARARDEHRSVQDACCATSSLSTPRPLTNKVSGQPFAIGELEEAIAASFSTACARTTRAVEVAGQR